MDPTSTLTFTRFPSKAYPRLLAAVKQTEKHTFPASEAFDFDSELRKRTTALFCALDSDGELVAYAVYVRTKLVTRIHKVCVVERWRGRGMGRWMMERVLGELRRAAASEVDLWVDVARVPARRLYAACGFAEKEVVHNYYGAGRDGVRMLVDLRECGKV